MGPPPTGHVRRFIDSGVFVLPVGGPSRSLLEVRGAPWVALPALICSFHCHGVFLSGDQQEEKVAKLHIHSSSKRKKPPKSSFSMGFRSYVRHFRGAILGLLCPSLPWCFPIRGPAAAAAKASAAAGCSGRRKR